DQGGNRAAQIQERVQFDRGLGRTKPRPGKQGQAEVDGGGIQSVNRLCQLDAHRFIRIQTAGTGDERVSQVGVDAPVAGAVGVGQGAVSHGGTEAHAEKEILPGTQTNFDVGQAIPVSDLGKSHGQKLVPTGEVINLAVAVITVDTTAELLRMNPVGQLRKNKLPSGHGASLARLVLGKMPKRNLNRSHSFLLASFFPSTLYNRQPKRRPDDTDPNHNIIADQCDSSRATAATALNDYQRRVGEAAAAIGHR